MPGVIVSVAQGVGRGDVQQTHGMEPVGEARRGSPVCSRCGARPKRGASVAQASTNARRI